MSMSSDLYGFKPADEKFRKMRAAYVACRDAGIEPPDEVTAFFGGEPEASDDAGVRLTLGSSVRGYAPPADGVTPWKAEMQDGFEVDLRKLDPTIKVLRFVNSY